MAQITPRITAAHLTHGQFTGSPVRAVGKLVADNGASVQLQLAGEGPLATVLCPSGTAAYQGYMEKGYFEVVGTLNGDSTISQMQMAFMGENLDMPMYEQMVALTHQFPDMFEPRPRAALLGSGRMAGRRAVVPRRRVDAPLVPRRSSPRARSPGAGPCDAHTPLFV
eukprot:CAMPEP_0206167632 /NCGR_PEP_ID=MMETSP1474-20131121/29028_1 /ASSEMBLY_ACC=CAM_ASM_001110 /TAXON_ID=97495 /ORGANISM="Imantonia sp., Strain RCC918" /LENGTH=166 /DNA_ID=CAMNT_0053572407 /DNA_START=26 /DNA_END=527 /DNA_ORIENTATION=-